MVVVVDTLEVIDDCMWVDRAERNMSRSRSWSDQVTQLMRRREEERRGKGEEGRGKGETRGVLGRASGKAPGEPYCRVGRCHNGVAP